jgi:hypothetical protein
MSWTNRRRAALIGCCFALLALMGSTAALAGTVSYTDPSISFPLSPGSDTGSVPQWDPALYPGQALVSVVLYINVTAGASVTAENDSAIGGNMGVNLTGLVSSTSPGLSATAAILASGGPVAVAASDGNPGTGPDFHNFGFIAASDDDSDTIFAGFGPYIGNGNVTINVNGSGGFSVSGVTDSTTQVSSFGGFGLVRITYNYEPVPEPSSVALAALAASGLALAVWRRRRK